MSSLQAIQIKRRQLVQAHGLDEDDWRDLVQRMTGQRSTRNLKPVQSRALLGELDRLLGGRYEAPSKGSRKSLSGPYAKKLQALWIACWNMGIIDSADDKALNAFAVRQANVSHANWIRHQEDAVAVIEALKSMLERHGVDWTNYNLSPVHCSLPGFKIACAQWRKLEDFSRQGQTLSEYVRHLVDRPFAEMTAEDWIVVMNDLGRKIRAQKKQDHKE
ncbi:regulatory protein GemA [Halocynthiibacter styelae]|uniref:Regulatory protein GemA n=1 Tax=Halocynthiibacter styelae TaxID=2761955 RepID=A0A8J7ITI6_9RHOB|nr:regulatory protein GemA [Paenihalocynthiibacter styelae]MBI1495381.1 regulatory protein GemA [Paenihalocynthiibacter styelae]